MFDFGLQEGALTIVRAIASVGGAVVGWFVCDPLTRITYRLSFKGATPGAVLFMVKAAGAAGLAVSIWIFMPLGGRGPGFGPGKGGVPGPGPGGATDAVKDAKTSDSKTRTTPKTGPTLELIDIEIIDDKRYKDDGADRYFLVKRAEPALSRDELEAYLKKNQTKIEVTPVLTKGSIGVGGDDSPLSQLLALTKRYDIKTLQPKTP